MGQQGSGTHGGGTWVRIYTNVSFLSEHTQTHSHWYAEAFIPFKTTSRCESGGSRINTGICSPVWGTSWPSVSRKLKKTNRQTKKNHQLCAI